MYSQNYNIKKASSLAIYSVCVKKFHKIEFKYRTEKNSISNLHTYFIFRKSII